MKPELFKKNCYLVFLLIVLSAIACNPSGTGNSKKTEDMTTVLKEGTFSYDVTFFANQNIKTIELKDSSTGAAVLVVPNYQGRVMTSTTGGKDDLSFGWINYKLIRSGEVKKQFNPYGGEERFWLGPEGGNFSIYFTKGKEQVYANWQVPKEIDTEPFDIVLQNSDNVKFKKDFELTNYKGTTLKVGVERSVKLLTKKEAEDVLNLSFDDSVKFVAYQSENILMNNGKNDWTKETGFLSLWMLSMFNPSPEGVVFIPIVKGSEKDLGKKVSDDYFGKVPSDRLLVKDDMLFFKTDGKHRSKIGISPKRSLPLCGSYDAGKKVLTLLLYSKPDGKMDYVNSKWGKQDDPLAGDVVNSYNDGPVEDGSIMGPFYEIESSSPAAILKVGGKMVHVQKIFHFTGNEDKLSSITEKLFNLSISEIKQAFK